MYEMMYFSGRVIIFRSNDVNVWAGSTRYFKEKQRIILVHIMLCYANTMLCYKGGKSNFKSHTFQVLASGGSSVSLYP